MKKTFSLLPILKIREYREYVELQNFAKVAQGDTKLAVEYNAINAAERDVTIYMHYMQKNKQNFETMRDVHKFLSSCEVRKRDILAQREKLKPALDEARVKYAEVHKKAEVLRIARNAHDVSYKADVAKKFFEELQERQLCRR